MSVQEGFVMYYVAYLHIYANPGNMTAGADGQTIDQMSLNRIEKLIASLKNESYWFSIFYFQKKTSFLRL